MRIQSFARQLSTGAGAITVYIAIATTICLLPPAYFCWTTDCQISVYQIPIPAESIINVKLNVDVCKRLHVHWLLLTTILGVGEDVKCCMCANTSHSLTL